VAALGLRLGVGAAAGQPCRALTLFALANLSLAVFHLMPIPGLDGARLLALVMPFRAREVYQNLEPYLILFVLLIFFLLGSWALSIIRALTNALMDLIVGPIAC
jgi:Zn-dependent protease